MSEFAVGTQRANRNGKRVTSVKPSLRDRDDRRRNSVLGCQHRSETHVNLPV